MQENKNEILKDMIKITNEIQNDMLNITDTLGLQTEQIDNIEINNDKLNKNISLSNKLFKSIASIPYTIYDSIMDFKPYIGNRCKITKNKPQVEKPKVINDDEQLYDELINSMKHIKNNALKHNEALHKHNEVIIQLNDNMDNNMDTMWRTNKRIERYNKGFK